MKITKTNYEKMTDSFYDGLKEMFYNNHGTLENYFRVEVEDDYIVDWYWSSQTSNTYFVDEDITVYHISDFNINCSIDCMLDRHFDCIKDEFEEKYKDDENSLDSLSKWEDFRDEYYKKNEDDIILDLLWYETERFTDVLNGLDEDHWDIEVVDEEEVEE